MRRHSNFFSSLKQVEKRLKSEEQPPPPKPQPPSAPPPKEQEQPPVDGNYTCSWDSLSSPIYLHSIRPNHSSILEESSEAAAAFLSSSPPFPSTTQEDPSPAIKNPEKRDDFEGDPDEDVIQRLIELLGLSDCEEKEEKGRERAEVNGCDCDCEGGFYSKIVGVKGPKCGKEVERLEGWIKHLMNDGGNEKIEPLRLGHLLLGKAAFGGFELEFPSTIHDFLLNDLPTD